MNKILTRVLQVFLAISFLVLLILFMAGPLPFIKVYIEIVSCVAVIGGLIWFFWHTFTKHPFGIN